MRTSPLPWLLLPPFLLAIPHPHIIQDTGQATINTSPTNHTTNTTVSLTATLFSNFPSPSRCRGRPVLHLTFPPGPGSGPDPWRCCNIPTPSDFMCGTFIAPSGGDGGTCEASLFAKEGCRKEWFCMFEAAGMQVVEPRLGGFLRKVPLIFR